MSNFIECHCLGLSIILPGMFLLGRLVLHSFRGVAATDDGSEGNCGPLELWLCNF